MSVDDKLGPAANPEHQAKARRSQKAREAQWRETLHDVASTPAGRRFIWWLVNDCCRLHETYPAPMPTDNAHFNEGRRFVAGAVLQALRIAVPDLHKQILTEGYAAFDEPKETPNDD